MVVTMEEDELSEKNLHIDIDSNENELNTGMIDSGLDVNSSADTDILDDNVKTYLYLRCPGGTPMKRISLQMTVQNLLIVPLLKRQVSKAARKLKLKPQITRKQMSLLTVLVEKKEALRP